MKKGKMMNFTQQQKQSFFAEMDFIYAANKSFDANPVWEIKINHQTKRLVFFISLRLKSILGHGVALRLCTPADSYGKDIYGHIEINSAKTLNRTARLCAVEYEPKNEHRNGKCQADSALSWQCFRSRYHPYKINKGEGIKRFFQETNCPSFAKALPPEVKDYQSYLKFCEQLYKCADMRGVPQPPWQQQLI